MNDDFEVNCLNPYKLSKLLDKLYTTQPYIKTFVCW